MTFSEILDCIENNDIEKFQLYNARDIVPSYMVFCTLAIRKKNKPILLYLLDASHEHPDTLQSHLMYKSSWNVLNTFIELCSISLDTIRKNVSILVERNRLEILKKFYEKYPLNDDNVLFNIFNTAMKMNMVVILDWLLTIPISKEIMTFGGCCIFRSTVDRGHLQSLEWFQQHNPIDKRTIRYNDNIILTYACRSNNPIIMRWLKETYNLKFGDAMCVPRHGICTLHQLKELWDIFPTVKTTQLISLDQKWYFYNGNRKKIIISEHCIMCDSYPNHVIIECGHLICAKHVECGYQCVICEDYY